MRGIAAGLTRSLVLTLACLLAFQWPPATAGAQPTALRIDAVEPGSIGEIAGFQTGDVIRGWRRTTGVSQADQAAEGGLLPDAQSFEAFVVDIAPRVPALLEIERDGGPRLIALPARTSQLGLTVMPAPEMPARFAEALREGNWERAEAVVAAALAEPGAPPGGLPHAAWRLRRAALLRQQGRLDEAAVEAEAALEVRQRLAAGSWDEADALAELGRIALARRRLDEAATRFDAALAIVGRAQSTMESVRLGFSLAGVEWRQGRLPEAERRLRVLMTLTDDLAPDSADQARHYNLLGILRSQSGDLPAAERAFLASRDAHARRNPGSLDTATALNNLGNVTMQRGRYADAESFYRQSLAIKERVRVPAIERMSTLGNLGIMSVERGDFDGARAYLSQALAIVREAAPGSLPEGAVLSNLARAERLAGRHAEAASLVQESLAIRGRQAPDTVLHAFTLTELGRVHEAAGAFGEAADAHRRALAIREQLAPDGSNVADTLDALGQLAARQGDAGEARRLYERAAVLWQRVAPASVYEGRNLLAQARLDAAAGRVDAARERYAQAADIFDGLASSVGGAFDTQAGFRSSLTDAYAEYAALLLSAGEAEEAFRVTERARARVFLAMLAERDVAPPDDVPPELDETRRALTAEYDETQSALAALSPSRDAARIDERVGRLRDIRQKLAAVRADIARVSPRSALLYPAVPLDASAVRRILPPGTLAVSYLVGEHASHAFVLSAAGLETFEIPWGRARLAEEIARFQRLLARPDGGMAPLLTLGAELYGLLMAPAAAAIARHDRLLIVPDGPLHTLPFAALVREPGAARRYLVEWKSLHQVPSLTVYARLLSMTGTATGSQARLLAVGDPAYGGPAADTDEDADRTRETLPPLPGSRREVEAITRLYGRRASSLLGHEATEARVREAMAGADIVHLAVHGRLNVRFPLDSALALSADAGPNDSGLLHAWEIFEEVRLRAALVVLSACDTAGDRESGGEGLIGLARAFQFAGTPSVVATLWRVEDDATGTLMSDFYRELRRGRPVDESLARAQRAMARSRTTAHPYYWAAFVLSGRH